MRKDGQDKERTVGIIVLELEGIVYGHNSAAVALSAVQQIPHRSGRLGRGHHSKDSRRFPSQS